MDNREIANVFDEIADLLEISGANFFRVRAYRNAARITRDHPVPLSSLTTEQLCELPGIGEELAAKIETLSSTGRLPFLDELKKKVPSGLVELRSIRGLGPKRIKLLGELLEVRDKEGLRRAAEAGRIRAVRGLGAKLEEQILHALAEPAAQQEKRMLYADAEPIVNALLTHMRKCRAATAIDVAGSFRRRRETVGDIDVLAASSKPQSVTEQLRAYGPVKEVLASGETKTSVVLADGLQVDLRVVAPGDFGAALLYFTGSKAHGIHLRKIAQDRSLLLNEYGLFRGKKAIAAADEKGVYRALGLEWIPPEIREDRGEIEAAASGKLPHLIARKDLRGDLHSHSTWTDGRASIEEMARGAARAGLEYLAVTDHSKRLTMAHGLDPKRLREQWREIDRVVAKVRGIKLLRGIEVDILEDGSLDLPDDVLSELDWVVASVHYKIEQNSRDLTRRIVKAIGNPNVDVLGHPTGRLINHRAPGHFDLDEVLRAARGEGCAMEINSQPERLDLDDVMCIAAKRAGVKMVISSDAHHPNQFAGLEYGVNQARRGWIESSDVLNSRPLSKLRQRSR
ncbi:MAG TPA: DNA polymerase/3'-5' exonuclease PolX [Candidatus Binataceae bacterium]|nr:DNA polymerase/3'-5' exonuclease PolX [Candidatus Binataceae bacterium]